MRTYRCRLRTGGSVTHVAPESLKKGEKRMTKKAKTQKTAKKGAKKWKGCK